jgi:hypothetical protein
VEALHPNVGALLKKILILPSSSFPKGAHTTDDHLTNIVPIFVTPNYAPHYHAAIGENFVQNDAPAAPQSSGEISVQSDKTYPEIEVDSGEHSLPACILGQILPPLGSRTSRRRLLAVRP